MNDRPDPSALKRGPLAIHFSEAAFTESRRREKPVAGGPQGLVGREVANRSLLQAILRHKKGDRAAILLETDADRPAAAAACGEALRDSPRPQHVRLVPPGGRRAWMAAMPGGVVMFGQPPDAGLAEEREELGPHAFAMCGVTHTLATPAAVAAVRQLVGGSCYAYDTLVCTSAAVQHSAQVVIDGWRDHLLRLGRHACEGPTLERIPLGIDTRLHRPAVPSERLEARRRLGIGCDAFVVLFVGRLSHHAKSQPLPMLLAAQKVAERSKQRVVLLQSGWFANEAIRRAFSGGAAQFAPDVQTIFVDGVDEYWRHRVWHAADCFVSLADSIQETFGLTPIEAMARRLPVLVSDWDGYRDAVNDGRTGLTVPTYMHAADNQQAAVQLIRGEISYDRFLAEIGQRVVVDVAAAVDKLVLLATDPAVRQRLAEAGYQAVRYRYSWPSIVARYERLWRRSEGRRRDAATAVAATASRSEAGPTSVATASSIEDEMLVEDPAAAAYPDVRRMFELYPTAWIDDAARLGRGETPAALLPTLADHGLSGHCAASRLTEPSRLQELLREADSKTIADAIATHGSERERSLARSSALWLMKYGLLRCLSSEPPPDDRPLISFVTTCMGRLDDLRETLPRMLAQLGCEVVVVDYSCPQRAGEWVRSHHPEVRVVEVPGKTSFHRSAAKNAGIAYSRGKYLCFIDGDILLDEDFVAKVRPLLAADTALKRRGEGEGVGGTFIAPLAAVKAVGGHDLAFEGWGEEDDDLLHALKFHGLKIESFSRDLIVHREHDDTIRTRFHEVGDRRRSHMINRVYRSAKWDWTLIRGVALSEAELRSLYARVQESVLRWLETGGAAEITIDTGRLTWTPLKANAARQLRYTVESEPIDRGGSPST